QRDAILRRAPRHARCIGAGDHRLGGRAAGVHARPAKQLALHEAHRPAGSRRAPAQRRPGLARADNDGVKTLHARQATISTAPMIAIASSVIAAGRSLPNEAASLARNAAPPYV